MLDGSAALDVLMGLGAILASIGAVKIAPAAISVGFKWIKGAIFG